MLHRSNLIHQSLLAKLNELSYTYYIHIEPESYKHPVYNFQPAFTP